MIGRVARSLTPRGSGKGADTGVPGLVVQSALIEYGYLKQETLQVFQHMLATATLGLAIAGATASLALTNQLGPIEQAPILLLASALILMNGMAVISMSLHVTTVARWLQHIAEAHVRAVLTSAAAKGETIPSDLLGWEDYQFSAAFKGWGRRLRGFVWLELVPLPVAAVAFFAGGAWEVYSDAKVQSPVSIGLLVADVALAFAAAVYSYAVIQQVKTVRNSTIAGDAAKPR